MKKLIVVIAFGMLLSSAAGCRIAECWRYAWNSRFGNQQPQQTVIVSEPCVVADPCSTPCSTPTMVAPGPVPAR